MTDEPMADLIGRPLGEFIVRAQIGEGGYAVVYRCEQPLLGREAVIKVLHARRRGDGAAGERFLREARLASRLDHPYAAHVYQFGVETDGILWIAMEMVQGVTLGDWLAKHGPMPLDQFVPFFRRVAQVVRAAHERGIVHRDLKPSNVMVIEDGGLFPKLLDFGIARASNEVALAEPVEPAPEPEAHDYRLTSSGSMLGSAPYMAPEQWKNARDAGPAADIYSLGVVAYEALTGRRPFFASTADDYCRQHLEAEVPPLGREFPPALDQALRRALAKDPAARQASVLDLASELRAALRMQPRELLRASAQQWEDRARPAGLLWGRTVLADLERWNHQAPAPTLTKLECSFIAASRRRARHVAWVRRLVVVLAAAGVVGALQLRAAMRTRMAEQIALEAEIEQGRQALLHGESSEAVRHLEQAYQEGARSFGVEFMLDRALQPRMAEAARFTVEGGRMWSAVFAPDGKRVLTADDQGARMWDAATHRQLFAMSRGASVYQAAFSPDGGRIVTAGYDGSVGIWDAATGAAIRALTYRRTGSQQWHYARVAASARVVAAIDMIGSTVHVWDAATGAPITELTNDGHDVSLLAISPDGHWLATSGGETVRVWNTSSWRQAVAIPGPRTRSIRFDPSNQRLAVGTYDGAASIWEIPSGALVRCLREAGESVDALAFSLDGTLIATGSRDGTEQVWDARSGGQRAQFNSHHGKIYAVEFAATGDHMLSAGADGAVVVSDFATGMTIARLEGPPSAILTAHFDDDARRVVSASQDGTARVWNAASPYLRWRLPPIGPECDSAESLIPDQRFMALSCPHRGTHVWDTAQAVVLAELPGVTTVVGGYDSALPAVTTSGDRAAIAQGNRVEIYGLPGGKLLRTITHGAAVNAVAFAPAGHDLVTGAVDGSLLVTRDDREPIALPASLEGIDAASLLADGRVVVADAGSRLRVIDPDRGAAVMTVTSPFRVRQLRPSPDGTRLLAIATRGNNQEPPALWDLDRHVLVTRLEGHVGRVFAARFAADGTQIITAGSDGTVRLWDATTGNPRMRLQGDSHFLADATLDPAGKLVVGGGSDGFLRFWDASNGRLLWILQVHKSHVIGVHYEGTDIVTRGFSGDIARWKLPLPDSPIAGCHSSTCSP